MLIPLPNCKDLGQFMRLKSLYIGLIRLQQFFFYWLEVDNKVIKDHKLCKIQ